MNNLNVLILEDEKGQQDLISRYIKDVYNIFSCYTYDDAEKLIQDKPAEFFKVFIIDLLLSMDGKTGLEFIEEHLDGCKTIVISGYLSPEIIDEVVNLGVFATFEKPIHFDSLFISMNSIIRCENKI